MAGHEERRGIDEAAAPYRHLARPTLTGTVADLDARYKLDRKEAAKAAAKAVGVAAAVVVGAKTGAFASPNFLPGLVGSLFEAAGTAFGTGQNSQSDEARLWTLVRSALDLAWLAIAKEALIAEKRDLAKLETAVATSLDAAIQYATVTIDESFFARPETTPVVPLARKALARWLYEAMDVGAAQAEDAARHLAAAFVAALRAVAARDPDTVGRIAHRLRTPFDAADERLRARAAYAARLEADLALPLFDGPASLRNLYQPLRAYQIVEREVPDSDRLDSRRDEIGRFREQRQVVDLATALREWLEASDSKDSLRVVSGGPGSGKSSFARWWAAEIAGAGRHVLLVPLHRLEDSGGSLSSRLDRFARSRARLAEEPLQSTDPLLLILDGLDELVMQGNSGGEVAESLVRDVERLLSNAHDEGRRLQVLLGGREILVDRLKGRFPLKSIFHLLPYRLNKAEQDRSGDSWDDPDGFLDVDGKPENDLRHAWWQAWGAVIGENIDGVPAEIEKHAKLAALSEQPLLNFLLALVRQASGGLPVNANVNTVYAELLGDVWRRRWGAPRGQEDGRLEAHKDLSLHAFEHVFQAIALAAWHGGATRAVTTQAIKGAIERERLDKQLKLLQDAGQEGALRLLTAFYWREAGIGSSGERAWELTHKSFGEYLVARRLVRAIERVAEMRERNRQEVGDGWSAEEALTKWVALCGPNTLDYDLLGMLRGEVALHSKEIATAWQRTLVDLLNWYLRHDLPMHKADPAMPTFQEAYRQARNAISALIASVNACAKVSMEISRPSWPKPIPTTGFDDSRCSQLVRFILGEIVSLRLAFDQNPPSVFHRSQSMLSLMDYSHQNLIGLHFSGQDLRRSVFADCWLVGGNFTEADLEEANFDRAHLDYANFYTSRMSKSSFIKARLNSAYLNNTNLTDANFAGANLVEADMTDALLKRTNFTGANLTGVRGLKRSQLRQSRRFRNAILPENLPDK